MSEKMSIREVADLVENEGIGYAIECYLGADEIEDENLRDKWRRVGVLIGEIREILGVDD